MADNFESNGVLLRSVQLGTLLLSIVQFWSVSLRKETDDFRSGSVMLRLV